MHRFESGRRLFLDMKIFQEYFELINRLSGKRGIIIILFVSVLIFNYLIFPAATKNEPKMLDTRFIYSTDDVALYLSQLSPSQKTNSAVMHLSADLIYPVIYTLLLSSLLFITGNRYKDKLTFFPLFIFFTDILENTGIVLLLLHRLNFTILYKTALTLTPLMTTVKWIFVGLNILMLFISGVIFLISSTRRYSRK